LPLFLTDEFGYSDTEAGTLFGTVGVSLAIQAVLLGTVVDKIGVKFSTMFAGLFGALTGFMIAFAVNEAMLLFTLIVLMPLGGALAIPAGKIAPRRYTLPATRSAAFSLFFWIQQLA